MGGGASKTLDENTKLSDYDFEEKDKIINFN